MIRYLYRAVGMLGAMAAILEYSAVQTLLACLIVLPYHFLTVSDPTLSEIPLIVSVMFAVATTYEFALAVYFGTFIDAGDAAEEPLDGE